MLYRFTALILSACALSLAACGGGTIAAHHEAAKLKNNPQFQKDEARVKRDLQTCLSKVGFHKKAFVACMVPGGKAKAEACAQNAVRNDGFLTHHKQLVQDLVGCGVR